MSPSDEAAGRRFTPLRSTSRPSVAATEAIGVTRLSDGVVVDANVAFARLLGRELSQVIGRRTIDLVVWETPSQRIEFVRELRRTGSVRDFEFVSGRTEAPAASSCCRP